MTNSTLTLDQLQSLKEEFVDWKIDEMSREEMADWIRTVYMKEMDYATFEDVKEEIDHYDENLYDLMLQYVTGVDGSWEELQEYKHELHADDWIDDC